MRDLLVVNSLKACDAACNSGHCGSFIRLLCVWEINFWAQDEKTLGMWSKSQSRLSSEPYHGLQNDQRPGGGPDVTLRLSNLDRPTGSSSESDVSSSKNLRSPSGGGEEADIVTTSTTAENLTGRPVNPATSPNPEFSSVEEKTAMLGIAEPGAAPVLGHGTIFRSSPSNFDPYSDHERSPFQHDPLRSQSRLSLPSSMLPANEIYLRVAAEEHRFNSTSNLRSSEADGHHQLQLLGTLL